MIFNSINILIILGFSKEFFPYDEEVIIVFCLFFVFSTLFNIIENSGNNYVKKNRKVMEHIWKRVLSYNSDMIMYYMSSILFTLSTLFLGEWLKLLCDRVNYKGFSYTYLTGFLYNNLFAEEMLKSHLFLEKNCYQLLYLKKMNTFFNKFKF